MTRVLILHDCAGVMLHLKDKLVEHGFDVEYHYFRLENEPYLDYGIYVKKMSKRKVATFVIKKAALAKYDIFHTYNTRFPNHPLPYEYVLAKLRGKKVVVHFHGSDLRLGYRKPSRKILLKNKALLVSTPDLLQYCPSRAQWLPNPVDPSMFHPLPTEPHEGLHVLHSATMPELKGTHYVTDAVAKLRAEGLNIQLEVVGFPHPVPIKDMPKYYQWCDLVVEGLLLPAFGLVGVEAMMMNKLLLSHVQLPKLIMKAPMVYVDSGNIADRLRYFYENPKEIERQAKGGREWAIQHHDPDRVVEKLIEVYENA